MAVNLASATNLFYFFWFYFETFPFSLTTNPTAAVLTLSLLTYLRQSSVHIHSKNSKYQQALSEKNVCLSNYPNYSIYPKTIVKSAIFR